MAGATLIDGKAMAARLTETIKTKTAALSEHGITPGLAVVIVGEDSASQVYVRNKKRTAEACGFLSVQHSVDKDCSQDELLELIRTLNDDADIHGIMVQLPIPDPLDATPVTQRVLPAKDGDGFHYEKMGKLTGGDPGGQ